MNIEAVVAYCLGKAGAEETYPFGDHVLVAKVGGKGFAFIGQDEPGSVAVKCGATRDEAAEVRERYPDSVTVMDYLGRYGWNRVELGAGVPDAESKNSSMPRTTTSSEGCRRRNGPSSAPVPLRPAAACRRCCLRCP